MNEAEAREAVLLRLPALYEAFFRCYVDLHNAQDDAGGDDEWSDECDHYLGKLNELTDIIRHIHQREGTFPRRLSEIPCP